MPVQSEFGGSRRAAPAVRPLKSEAKTRGYHHGDLRNALIEGALELTKERHGPFFTLRELASKIGVSHAAPYRHFPDRTALFEAIAAEGFRRLCRYQARVGENTACPIRRVAALGEAYIDFAHDEPNYFRIMFSPECDGQQKSIDVLVEASSALNNLIDAVRVCQEKRAIRPGDPKEIAVALWCAVHGVATLMLDGHLRSVGDQGGVTKFMLNDLILTGLIHPAALAMARAAWSAAGVV